MGNEFLRPHLTALLAEAYGRANEVQRGLALIGEALALAEAHDERYFEAEIHRLRGELLVMAADESEAAVSFRRAIDVAREQEAKSWELRATTSLSRLRQRRGERAAAQRDLARAYNGFSEGFDTPDLREARDLLDALSDA
jgi:predicted ATPase